MEYCVYHVTTDGSNEARMDYVGGRTENDCWEEAKKKYGEENIYGFTRAY